MKIVISLVLLFLAFPVEADVYSEATATVQQEMQNFEQYCYGDHDCVCTYVYTAYEGSHSNYLQSAMQIDSFWANLACSFYGCMGWSAAWQMQYWYYVALSFAQHLGTC